MTQGEVISDEIGEDTGIPVAGDAYLVAAGSTPGAPVIDLGATLTNVSGDVTDEGPEISRRDFLAAAIGHPLGDEVELPGSSQATADDDEAELDDTDEHGNKVDTSDIGYETPRGEREPSA